MKRRDFLKLPLLLAPITVVAGVEYEPHIDNEYPEWVKNPEPDDYPWFDASEQYGWYVESPDPEPPLDVLLDSAYNVIPEGYRHKIDIITKTHPFRLWYSHAWKYIP